MQIKPTTFEHAPEYERKWRDTYKSSHEKREVEQKWKINGFVKDAGKNMI